LRPKIGREIVGGMFDYTPAQITPGRTVEILLDTLPKDRWTDPETGEVMIGDYPICHVEQLGPDNERWIAATIDRADPKRAPKKDAPAPKVAKVAKQMTVAAFKKGLTADREERRADVLIAVRSIVCRHKDGTLASDADIPAWVESLPQHAIDRIYAVAWNQMNFVDGNFTDPNEIAEK
jgi:hypothetical protein